MEEPNTNTKITNIVSTSLPVEVTDGQVSLLAADDYILPRNTHVCHLLHQRLAAEVLPIYRVQVEGVFILARGGNRRTFKTLTAGQRSLYLNSDLI